MMRAWLLMRIQAAVGEDVITAVRIVDRSTEVAEEYDLVGNSSAAYYEAGAALGRRVDGA